MKKEEILREELARMRQLMGMNGSLYQKPIMGEHERHGAREPFGPGSVRPDPGAYKGGESDPGYATDVEHWTSHNPPRPAPRPPARPGPAPRPPASPPPSPSPPPASPPASPPSPAPRSQDQKNKAIRKGSSSGKAMSGDYILPMSSIKGIGGKGKSTKGVKRANQKTRKKVKNKKKKED
tara:strand:- start:139 stop:678 length:540 start_codon:yes stop_codon:yes gene_type:complete